MIVVDASALLEMLLQTQRANQLMQRALEPSQRLHAPHLLDVEVTQVLRRLAQRKEITIARAEQALNDLTHLLVERHEHRALLPRVWQLRDSLTAYDAVYVALAELLGAPLLTCDGKIASAPGHDAKVVVV